jgi:pimeloyl-ACP methyl ester carboxylesterase
VRGVAAEAAWIFTHVAFYPVGILSERLREPVDRYTMAGLRPHHRGLLVGDVSAPGTPILLLHGWIDNRSIFTKLVRSLRRRGFGRVSTVNLPLYATDIPAAARRLKACVEEACDRSGYGRVCVVAHSLGGLVARYYVQKLGGDERVHTLVMLGTPHAGTRAARLMPAMVPYPLLRQLRPGSPILRELDEPAPGCRTRFLCFAGDLDRLVVPPSSALLEHPDLDVRNVWVQGSGHHSLTFNSLIVHEIATALSRLEEPAAPGAPVRDVRDTDVRDADVPDRDAPDVDDTTESLASEKLRSAQTP